MPIPSAIAVFAQRLRAQRTEKGLTQAELGQRIGMSFEVASTRINRYERGVHGPDLDTAERLAHELGVPLAYFVARDPVLAEAILGFANLSRERQATVLKAIQTQTAQQDRAKSAKGAAKKALAKSSLMGKGRKGTKRA